MRYDAILFDLDGTLTASAPGIVSSVRHTLHQMGFPPVAEEVLHRFVGPPLHTSFQTFAGMDAAQSEKAITIYREHYTDKGIFNALVYPGIPNLLRALKKEGVYIALATAKPTGSAKRVLAHFGLARFFDTIIGADLDRRETDKISLLRDALPPRYKRAAMVGDRSFDMEAAKSLGLSAIGVSYGYGSEKELWDAGADAIAGDVGALFPLLLDAPEMPPGFFITMEGLDGSGKTTQMNALSEYIQQRGYEVLLTREPGGTPISEDIRDLVLDPCKSVCAHTEALLYAASRAQLVRERIRPALKKGQVVLCDRFVDSSIAYQGAGRELGMEKVLAINAFAIGKTLPDLTLLFTVDAQSAFLRRSAATALDRLERAGEAFYQRVYQGYVTIAEGDPARVRPIDARRSIQDITADACQQVERLLKSR